MLSPQVSPRAVEAAGGTADTYIGGIDIGNSSPPNECIDCGAGANGVRCRSCYWANIRYERQIEIDRVLALPLPEVEHCCWPDGCSEPIFATGLCKTHRGRATTLGIVSKFQSRRRYKALPDACAHPDGCTMSFAHPRRLPDGSVWCFAHAERIDRNGDPGPVGNLYRTDDPVAIAYRAKHQFGGDVNGRVCQKCDRYKPWDQFESAECKYPRCADCRSVDTRELKLQRFYGMTTEQFDSLLESQGGVCANVGCGVKEPGGRWNTWHIDHDHLTNEVRGLLCNKCNLAIGHASDSPEILRGLAEYVARRSQLRLAINQ